MQTKLTPELQEIADGVTLPADLDVSLSLTEAGAVRVQSDAMRCEFYIKPDALRRTLEGLAAEFIDRTEADCWDCEATQFDRV